MSAETEAIAAWNTRAALPAVTATLIAADATFLDVNKGGIMDDDAYVVVKREADRHADIADAQWNAAIRAAAELFEAPYWSDPWELRDAIRAVLKPENK